MSTARTLFVTLVTFTIAMTSAQVPAPEMPAKASLNPGDYQRTAPSATAFRVVDPNRTTTPSLPEITVVFTHPMNDAELASLGSWALTRFSAAGLDLPPVALHLHRDEGACQGHRGIFNGDLMRVDVCDAGPLVVLHELAHAWTHVRVNGTQEDAYVQAGEFGAWTSPETPWNERGMEHAADTIAWALQEQPIRMLVEDGPIAERNEFFRMLTGRDAPRLVTS